MFEKIKEVILSNRIFHPLEIFALSILAPNLSVLSWRLNMLSNAPDKPKLKEGTKIGEVKISWNAMVGIVFLGTRKWHKMKTICNKISNCVIIVSPLLLFGRVMTRSWGYVCLYCLVQWIVKCVQMYYQITSLRNNWLVWDYKLISN